MTAGHKCFERNRQKIRQRDPRYFVLNKIKKCRETQKSGGRVGSQHVKNEQQNSPLQEKRQRKKVDSDLR